MDSQTTGLDFAVIGHQDGWHNIKAFMNAVRTAELPPLPDAEIKGIFPFIPARDLFRVKVRSATGDEINGVYIETFIDPDKLSPAHARKNMAKVMRAAACARKLGARITTLGGFSSIVMEGNLESLTTGENRFTTGNTLTAAFIVHGVEKAACQYGINLKASVCLVIGSTGDIGLACVRYMKNRVARLLLCARNTRQLEQQALDLEKEHINVSHSVQLSDICGEADIIISVTSSSGISIPLFRKNALICDAGYPKNLETAKGAFLFHGGMGQVSRGFDFIPDYSGSFYRYPAPRVIHGCILEAMVLAFEKKYEDYSAGKGNISVEKMNEVYRLALKHGVDVAPFYNASGQWPGASSLKYEMR